MLCYWKIKQRQESFKIKYQVICQQMGYIKEVQDIRRWRQREKNGFERYIDIDDCKIGVLIADESYFLRLYIAIDEKLLIDAQQNIQQIEGQICYQKYQKRIYVHYFVIQIDYHLQLYGQWMKMLIQRMQNSVRVLLDLLHLYIINKLKKQLKILMIIVNQFRAQDLCMCQLRNRNNKDQIKEHYHQLIIKLNFNFDDEIHNPSDERMYQLYDTNSLVEEFMLLANC
ncbi:unnamed protein product [Paramecium sonneborni]|uniref:Uncharacterized protein n=1 Tax=Paramecium sonneborni TaxID=65129 RepID=A0A8S1RB30_9CILI|nr:unnamed protein product [Paramecium sonneborni]